jgi:hypothetical protein
MSLWATSSTSLFALVTSINTMPSLLPVLLLASQAVAQICGTPDRGATTLARRANTNTTLPTVIDVPVYFHAVAAEESDFPSV